MSVDLLIQQLAERHGVNEYAVRTIWRALERSGGRLAQFSHPELGGYGQWMPGMTQIGDMFNHDLRDRVTSVCQELSDHYFSGADAAARRASDTPETEPPNSMKPMKPMSPMKPLEPMKAPTRWWPEELGENPNSTGGQNEMRYAFFSERRRLVVDSGNGQVQTYDTGDHQIFGVQQHQSGSGRKLTFTSQHGDVDLEKLSGV